MPTAVTAATGGAVTAAAFVGTPHPARLGLAAGPGSVTTLPVSIAGVTVTVVVIVSPLPAPGRCVGIGRPGGGGGGGGNVVVACGIGGSASNTDGAEEAGSSSEEDADDGRGAVMQSPDGLAAGMLPTRTAAMSSRCTTTSAYRRMGEVKWV